MKKLLIPIFLILMLNCRQRGQKKYTNYDFKINIKPGQHKIDCQLHMQYINPSPATDSLTFLLYEDMFIKSLQSSKIKNFRFDTTSPSPFRYTPRAGILHIRLNQQLRQNESINFVIKYEGKIEDVNRWKTNRVTENWIELGLYTPWFPYNPELDTISYQVKCKIPDQYRIAGNGKTHKHNNHWIINNSRADNDIIITGSKNIDSKTMDHENYTLKIHSAVNLTPEALDTVLAMGKRILDNYINWFGQAHSANPKIVIAPRKIGGAYSRKNIIVLNRISEQDFFQNRAGYLRYFAHEFAHNWWSKARTDSWEDWLNESFAEYSALLMVRNLIGKDEFEERIANKSENIDELPPLRGLDRDHKQAYQVLYNKGPYLLYNLEKNIGEAAFKALLKTVHENKISKTKDLINLIDNKFAPKTALELDSGLNR